MENNFCICLSRVSTGIQELDSQTDKLKQAAYLNGYKDDQLIIIEDKESAVKLSEVERNGLNKMKEVILDKSRKIDLVIVYELSRIARRPDVVYSIRDFLIEHKVQLQVLNPSFKLLKDDGSFDENSNILFSIFSGLAESEGYLRKARLARGKAKAAHEHKYLGGLVTYGYDVDKDGFYVINDEEAAVIKRIFAEYQNNTISEIAKTLIFDNTLKDYSYNSAKGFVTRILRNAIYAGIEMKETVTRRETRFTRKFPAIISEETFKQAQKKVIERKKYKNHSKYAYIGRGLMYTTSGLLFKPIHTHKAYEAIWQDGFVGRKQTINIEYADKTIWEFTKRMMLKRPKLNIEEEKRNIKDEIDSICIQLNTIEAKLIECDSKFMRIENRLLNGRINDEQADELEKEIEEEKQSYIHSKSEKEERREVLKSRLSKLSSSSSRMTESDLNALSREEKCKLAHEYIKSIIVDCTSRKERLLIFKTNECDDYVSWLYNSYTHQVLGPDGETIMGS